MAVMRNTSFDLMDRLIIRHPACKLRKTVEWYSYSRHFWTAPPTSSSPAVRFPLQADICFTGSRDPLMEMTRPATFHFQ